MPLMSLALNRVLDMLKVFLLVLTFASFCLNRFFCFILSSLMSWWSVDRSTRNRIPFFIPWKRMQVFHFPILRQEGSYSKQESTEGGYPIHKVQHPHCWPRRGDGSQKKRLRRFDKPTVAMTIGRAKLYSESTKASRVWFLGSRWGDLSNSLWCMRLWDSDGSGQKTKKRMVGGVFLDSCSQWEVG